MILHLIKPRFIKSGVRGRGATRAAKTPLKGVAAERGAERIASMVHPLPSRFGRSPHVLDASPCHASPLPYLTHSLPTYRLALPRINNPMRGRVMRARPGERNVRLYPRSGFHLDQGKTYTPIRVFDFGFDPKKNKSTSCGCILLPIKKSPIFT